MSEQPTNQPDEAQPAGAPQPAEETPEELTRALVDDVRRLEESN